MGLAPTLAVLVPLLRRDGEVELSEDEATTLMTMSAATIDRRLRGAKVLAEFRGKSPTPIRRVNGAFNPSSLPEVLGEATNHRSRRI